MVHDDSLSEARSPDLQRIFCLNAQSEQKINVSLRFPILAARRQRRHVLSVPIQKIACDSTKWRAPSGLWPGSPTARTTASQSGFLAEQDARARRTRFRTDDQLSIELRTDYGTHMRMHFVTGINVEFEEAVSLPAYAQATAARSLQYLRIIETTLIGFSESVGHLRVMTMTLADTLRGLQEADCARPLDPEGETSKMLAATSGEVRVMHVAAESAYHRAVSGPPVRDDNFIASARELCNSLTALHGTCEEMRQWIENHDAALNPAPGVTQWNTAASSSGHSFCDAGRLQLQQMDPALGTLNPAR